METNEKKPSNPFAFPKTDVGNLLSKRNEGMTLRDYFANSAMQGICASSLANYGATHNGHDENIIAERSYSIADAMLKRREL